MNRRETLKSGLIAGLLPVSAVAAIISPPPAVPTAREQIYYGSSKLGEWLEVSEWMDHVSIGRTTVSAKIRHGIVDFTHTVLNPETINSRKPVQVRGTFIVMEVVPCGPFVEPYLHLVKPLTGNFVTTIPAWLHMDGIRIRGYTPASNHCWNTEPSASTLVSAKDTLLAPGVSWCQRRTRAGFGSGIYVAIGDTSQD